MKRVTLFCGHYGSGKTNIAVNYAFHLKRLGYPVAIADIDVVNPYFRTKDSEQALTQAGIRVISLPFANTNVDLPALPGEVYSLVQNRSTYAVFDVGGDDRGAFALGRYVPYLLQEDNFDLFFVANFYRPLTRTAEQALDVLREIEAACGLRFTGIVHNSNLGPATTCADLEAAAPLAEQLGKLSGLPVVMTTAEEHVPYPGAFPLKLQEKIFE